MRSFLPVLLALAQSTSAVSISEFGIENGHVRILGNSFGNPAVDAEYDYVVVGGGTAGNTVAMRLASAGHSVAIVETGSFYQLDNGNRTSIPGYDYYSVALSSQAPIFVDYNIPTVPQTGYNDRSINYTQGRTFGGGSALNYMAYHRPTIGALQSWADVVDDQDWTWENVIDFYKKSVNFTGPNYDKLPAAYDIRYDESAVSPYGGPVQLSYGNHMFKYGLAFQGAFEKVGIHQQREGFLSGLLNGWSPFTTTVDPKVGTRSSSASSFLREAMENTNLKIYQTTTAKKIVFDEQNKATGVVVEMLGIRPTFEYTLSAKKEVIVSAGAFHSPQLLMVSGIGPQATLDRFNITPVHYSQGVGQNMWDQPWLGLSYKSNELTLIQVINNNPNYTEPAVEQYLNNQSGPLAGIGGGESVGWEKLPNASRSALSANTLSELAKLPRDWPEIEYINLAYSQTPPNISANDQYITVGACLVAPLSRGNMTISSTDTKDHPVISPNWMTHPGDLEVGIQAFKRATAWMEASGVSAGRYNPDDSVQSDEQIAQWIKNNGGLIYHPTSSCAMGKDNDSMAVLDSHARVRGVSGLRVVDASAFPFCPPGHPMSTVYMLAEKIADYIIRGQ